MHLLQAQQGDVTDGTEPVDPGQTPADIVVISANDAELATLAEAHAAMREGLGAKAVPTLRLARLDWLRHPYSVDLYLDDTLTRSKLVILRLLGGEAYWSYGLEQCVDRLRQAGVPFVALPGDDKPDDPLLAMSSAEPEQCLALWSYLIEGGPQNAQCFLAYAAMILGKGESPPAAQPLLRAGLYWPKSVAPDLPSVQQSWRDGQPTVAVVFYRSLIQGAGLKPINRLCSALASLGLNPLPIFVSSLKDPISAATLAQIFEDAPPTIVLNATSFAVGAVDGDGGPHKPTPLDAPGVPVLQIVFSSMDEAQWQDGDRGLNARDIAMNVALPEVDGRVLSRAIAFKGEVWRDEATQCPVLGYRAVPDRIAFVAQLAASWAKLQKTPPQERRVALVLANYPNKDGRLANGVGLDTPASCAKVMQVLAGAGYALEHAPLDGRALMDQISTGPTNALEDRRMRTGGATLDLIAYKDAFNALPEAVRTQIEERWGPPEDDPFVKDGKFHLAVHSYGHVVVGVQPARGYNINPVETYHSPDLVPPHGHVAFYIWLRHRFGANAVVHLGKHGNLEWLPGKAVSLSQTCFPEAVLGTMPHLYPFIVNDPGEGTQAKRRAQAVIIDHLTPPLTRAETYGPLRDLEALVDEYYEASGVDARRLKHLRDEILVLTQSSGIDHDAGITDGEDADSRLRKLDDYLCTLKESQIRDGLHIFGAAPEGRLETDLLAALSRLPRGEDAGQTASLIRALARDFDLLDEGFDPLDCTFSDDWIGPRPQALDAITSDPWRSVGDTVERLELYAAQLIAGEDCPAALEQTHAVLEGIETGLRPAIAACGDAELGGLLCGLDGRFVPPGPSGAPTRGRPDVLPTGRNFYSVDTRAVPTQAAWALGWKSAYRLIERHAQDHGDWPKRMALTAWGTANMRTGGDDIAQALAFMGVRPRWDAGSRRVIGFEILPVSVLGRPRVDITLRVSGFFRDAFPAQMDLIDSAARAVMELDEPEADNPAAARYREERAALAKRGVENPDQKAGFRVFGSKPGSYGAGLQALMDEGIWQDKSDIADAFLTWGSYAYGSDAHGESARGQLEERLSSLDAVVQNQDNHEHDLFDSDDYYQFEGGLAATAEHLSGAAPSVYHNDHSRPERPVIRTLDEEVSRVIRARVVNPKWIDGVKRHGYKGAFEIAATVDYVFAFAATTHSVRSHHFDVMFESYVADQSTRDFIEDANPAAMKEIAARFGEAIDRGLWSPKLNSAQDLIAALTGQTIREKETP